MTKTTRVTIPSDVEARVLIRSRRRCCLCYFWDDDKSQKDGQLAHVDRDPSNSVEDNLAYLCLPHHNRYDAKQLQGKNPTPDELRYAHDRLYDEFDAQPAPKVGVTVVIEGDYDSLPAEEFDRIMELIKKPLGGRSEIRIIDTRRGSILVDIELAPMAAQRLIDAISTGIFQMDGIVDARVTDVVDSSESEGEIIGGFDFYDLEDVLVGSGLIDPKEQENLLRLAVSKFGMRLEDVRANPVTVLVIGVTERLRVLDSVTNILQQFIADIHVLVQEVGNEQEFSREAVIRANESVLATLGRYRPKFRDLLPVAHHWPKLLELISMIESLFNDLTESCTHHVAESSEASAAIDPDDVQSRLAITRQLCEEIAHLLRPALEELYDMGGNYSLTLRRLVHERHASAHSLRG